MKIALVVGHNGRRRGAYSRGHGVYEYDFWGRLLDPWNDRDGCRVFRRIPGTGYSTQIDRCYQQVDRWDADVSVEFHFNSGGGTGSETLSSGTRGSLALADLCQDAMEGYLDLPERSEPILVRSKRQRGGRSLWAGVAPAVLVEPFFGDSARDCQRIIERGAAGLVEKIIKGI